MIFIFIALVFYTIAILSGAAASRNVNTTVAAALTTFISAFIPIIVAVPLLNKRLFNNHRFGILMALLSGVAIAVFAITINKAFSVNKVGIVTPVVFGGTIFLSTIASFFLFKEKTSPAQTIGLVLVGVGLLVIVYARATAK